MLWIALRPGFGGQQRGTLRQIAASRCVGRRPHRAPPRDEVQRDGLLALRVVDQRGAAIGGG